MTCLAWNPWWFALRRLLPLCLLLLAGCAGRSAVPGQEQLLAEPNRTAVPLEQRLAPSFLLEGTQNRYNRLGAVEASGRRGRATVTVNPDRPVLYVARRPFATERGRYTNLIYRIHFPATPFSLVPFHLAAGDHVGLLVILTLDADQRPLLVTTANTCGCYAITIPTALLPTAAYPDRWPTGTLAVYGEQLPAILPALAAGTTLQVRVRAEVHRVMDLQILPPKEAPSAPVQPAATAPLDSLAALPLGDGASTSFYHDRWPLTGHVKGAIKPWETLLLSLVSLDLFVGMDKVYDGVDGGANPFYTSLKPWNRSASDMNDFAAYLDFNGWKL